MLPPSGEQFRIQAAGYVAAVTESGGALRLLTYDDRPLLDGFAEDEMAGGGRGQLLMPWPNRIRDGRYRDPSRPEVVHQLALTEPRRGNASHGLVRWAHWSLVEQEADRVMLGCRVHAQTGYPWTLDLTVAYAVGPDGLTVTQSATNLADTAAPYASGAHPYLLAGTGPVDGWTFTCPAATRRGCRRQACSRNASDALPGHPYPAGHHRDRGRVPDDGLEVGLRHTTPRRTTRLR